MTNLRNSGLVDLHKRGLLKSGLSLAMATLLTEQTVHAAETSITVGFLNNYLPFSFLDSQGQLKGFDVDVVSRLADVMGVKLTVVSEGMAQLNKKIKAGDVVFLGNQLLATPENRREYDFVKPYATLQMVSVLHEDDTRDFLSLDDFLAKTRGFEEYGRRRAGQKCDRKIGHFI